MSAAEAMHPESSSHPLTPEELLAPEVEDHSEHPEYELLVGHHRTDGSFKTSEQLRMEYIHLTDELIRQMTEGVPVKDYESNETHFKRPDFVVWLDKSARPVSWLTKELWPQLAADAEGNVPEMPAFRFVNIDREQWVNQIDPEGRGNMNIDLISQSIIRSLRSLFVSPRYKKDGINEEIDRVPTKFDDKVVLIVDEVFASGRTLDIASKFFERAFPKAHIASSHWMKGIATVDQGRATGNADLPVWYKEGDNRGRGVDNRNDKTSQLSPSKTQRLGAWFLSTRLNVPDPDSQQLRRELHWLAQDAKDHKILVIPSTWRDDEYERGGWLNGVDSQGYIQLRRENSLRPDL